MNKPRTASNIKGIRRDTLFHLKGCKLEYEQNSHVDDIKLRLFQTLHFIAKYLNILFKNRIITRWLTDLVSIASVGDLGQFHALRWYFEGRFGFARRLIYLFLL